MPPQLTTSDLIQHPLTSTVNMDQTKNLNHLPAEVLEMICNNLPRETVLYVSRRSESGALYRDNNAPLEVFCTRPSGHSVMRKVCKELRSKILPTRFFSVRAHKLVRIAEIPNVICGRKIKVLNIEMLLPCNANRIVGKSTPLQIDFLLGCSPAKVRSQYPELNSLTYSMSGSSEFIEASQEFEVAIRIIIEQYSSATTINVESTASTIKIVATNLQG